jgi:hypothetical protein
MDRLAMIHATRKQLIADIREYVRSQKEEWQIVPWLAIQADGRTGWSGQAELACAGLWQVATARTGPCVFIDCKTGELVRLVRSTHNRRVPLEDKLVLELVAPHLDKLTAVEIVCRLQNEAAKKRPSYYSVNNWEDNARRREEMATLHGVDRTYKDHGNKLEISPDL